MFKNDKISKYFQKKPWKWAGIVAYLLIVWKVFFGIQMYSTDYYMISAIVDTWL